MAMWLKQSTAVTVKLGPFVDATDAVTAETGLTIAQADIRLSKNGGNIAQTNNATGATHDELGYYDVPLDATDTNTLGTLRVAVSEAGALPVWQDFMVVPANVYDSLVAGTDTLDVTATTVSDKTGYGLAAAQTFDLTGSITGSLTGSVGSIAAGGIAASAFAAGAIDAAALAADALGSAELSTAAADEIATQVWAAATRTLTKHPALTKNTASQKIPFLMVDATDGETPETGLTVTAQRSIDGGAFANATGTVAELASGWYVLTATAADTNGDVLVFRFTATGADTRELVAFTA